MTRQTVRRHSPVFVKWAVSSCAANQFWREAEPPGLPLRWLVLRQIGRRIMPSAALHSWEERGAGEPPQTCIHASTCVEVSPHAMAVSAVQQRGYRM